MEDQLDATQKGELQQLLENYPEVVRDLCPHGKMNWRKNFRYKEGCHSMQQPMRVNILWLQDNLATLSSSLHLAIF